MGRNSPKRFGLKHWTLGRYGEKKPIGRIHISFGKNEFLALLQTSFPVWGDVNILIPFIMTLSSASRVVAVDVGTKRVGIAKTDPLKMFAQVHGTFSPDEALDTLRSLDREEGIDTIVVGWPLTEEGEAAEATEMVEAYVERIEDVFASVEVVRRDERFTSEIAKDLLREAGVKQPGRYDKGRVDAAAAAVILQDYLNVQNR